MGLKNVSRNHSFHPTAARLGGTKTLTEIRYYQPHRERKQMTDTVLDRSVAEVVARLKDKGLISLYLCGSFGTQDELPSSDVDLLSVVKDDFDSREAADVDAYLRTEFTSQTGIKASLARITLSELAGDMERDQFIPLPLWVKQFPFFRRVWGQHIDLATLKVERWSLSEEARHLIEQIQRSIHSTRRTNGTGKLRAPEFAKMILHLAFVEVEAEYGLPFDPSYKKLTQSLGHVGDHIVHHAFAVRTSRIDTVDAFLALCEKAEEYVNAIEKRRKSW